MLPAFLFKSIPKSIPQLDAKRILITSYTLILSFSLTISLGIIFFLKDIYPLNLIFGFFTFNYIINGLLLRNGYYGPAKIMLYFSLLLQVICMSYALGNTCNLKVFYMPIAIIPFLIFGKKERYLFNFSILSTFINIILIYTIDELDLGYSSPISLETTNTIAKAFNLIALVCMLFLAYMFLSLSELGEELLYKSKVILEEQQAELSLKNGELESGKIELERLNNVKDKLLTIISHDLKSPINNIKSFAELMLEEKLQKEEITSFLIKFKESSFYTHQLLDNLVKWSGSHIASPTPVLRKIEVKPLIDVVLKQVDDIAKKKEVRLINTVDNNTMALADYQMLEISLRNIITNAIKFSNTEGKVVIGSETMEGRLRITIEDYGVGIPESMINDLFTPGLSTSRLGTSFEKGSGIGLLLCKQLVEANNGTIYVSSIPGVKTTFTVEIPFC